MFEEEFGESLQTFYLAVGKNLAWGDENVPDIPTDTFEQLGVGQASFWRDMVGLKKITSSSIETVIPRNTWTTGTIYSMYEHDNSAMFSTTNGFVVITDEFKVYKCIRNGTAINSGTSSTVTSTTKPIHITPNTTPIGSDGYQWRYMYTVSAANISAYLTTAWLPVGTSGSSAVDTNEGSVHVVRVTGAGSGYANGTVAITVGAGDGSGFAANAIIAGGVVTDVVVTNVGSGYTQLTLSLTSGGGSGATFKPIFSPGGNVSGNGHGHDLDQELGGFYRMMNVKLSFGESTTITTANDYRRVMLIKNPTLWGTTTLATGTNYRQTQRLTMTVVSGTLVADEVVTGGTSGATAKIVEWDATNTFLYLNDNDVTEGIKSAWTNGETLTGGTSSATATYNAGTANNPGLEPGSGDILYIDNRVKITRAADQEEDFKIIIEF